MLMILVVVIELGVGIIAVVVDNITTGNIVRVIINQLLMQMVVL